MNFKKILCLASAFAMCISMASCDSKDNNSSEDEGEKLMEMRDIPSTELVKEMTVGWNLGNTLDATGTTIDSEIAWQGNFTRKEMFDLVKASGFDVVRIPVTWEGHIQEDGTVDPEWMARVHEVVDYAFDNDLFVILNIHHEEWHFPSYDNLESAKAQLVDLWEQIAEEFKAYDEHLIFEGLNEPRKKGTNVEWTGGDEEGRDVVNQLNKAFVETIRNSGGNNPKRHLMVPTYAASSGTNAMAAFEMPAENDDKIIVSIHGYSPYNFALNTKGTAEWSADKRTDTADINALFNNIKTYFLDKGIPVIIGEWGSINKMVEGTETGDNRAVRVEHAKYYVEKAKEYGVPCIWWDNAGYFGSGENFGLMDRSVIPSWKFPAIVQAITGVEIDGEEQVKIYP